MKDLYLVLLNMFGSVCRTYFVATSGCRYCPNCKEHREASKKLDLWRLPEILVIHLKRFSYSRYFKNKLDTFVSFPIQKLDMGKYAKNGDASDVPYVYELYAISNHYGGLGGGHYSAYAKVRDLSQTFSFVGQDCVSLRLMHDDDDLWC